MTHAKEGALHLWPTPNVMPNQAKPGQPGTRRARGENNSQPTANPEPTPIAARLGLLLGPDDCFLARAAPVFAAAHGGSSGFHGRCWRADISARAGTATSRAGIA